MVVFFLQIGYLLLGMIGYHINNLSWIFVAKCIAYISLSACVPEDVCNLSISKYLSDVIRHKKLILGMVTI